MTKKNQLYFAKLREGVFVKFHRWYDGVAMMVFTKNETYGIKLRAIHVEALIAYLEGRMAKVREIIEHKDDLDYVEDLEEGGG